MKRGLVQYWIERFISLQWRHNEGDGVSNHQRVVCLLKRLFRLRSKKTSKLCVTGLCGGNSPVTDEFPAQRASNTESLSIWWRHHVILIAQPKPNSLLLNTYNGHYFTDIIPKYTSLKENCVLRQISLTFLTVGPIDNLSVLAEVITLNKENPHYCDVIMTAMASQITSVSFDCSTVCSGSDRRKHQSSASLAFVGGIHWWPMNSPHKEPLTPNMFPYDDIIMNHRRLNALLVPSELIWRVTKYYWKNHWSYKSWGVCYAIVHMLVISWNW